MTLYIFFIKLCVYNKLLELDALHFLLAHHMPRYMFKLKKNIFLFQSNLNLVYTALGNMDTSVTKKRTCATNFTIVSMENSTW